MPSLYDAYAPMAANWDLLWQNKSPDCVTCGKTCHDYIHMHAQAPSLVSLPVQNWLHGKLS